ncbi:hypothetical protein RKD37_008554 [Streptomyces ambofaciens]
MRLAPADLLGLGLLGLRTRKLRAALSGLGISIGIATMVVVTGIPASSHQALMDEMSALGSDMLRAQSVSVQNKPVALPEESVDMVRRIGPVTRVSAVANTHAQVRRSDLIDENDFSGAGLSVLAARRKLLEWWADRCRRAGTSVVPTRCFLPLSSVFRPRPSLVSARYTAANRPRRSGSAGRGSP